MKVYNSLHRIVNLLPKFTLTKKLNIYIKIHVNSKNARHEFYSIFSGRN